MPTISQGIPVPATLATGQIAQAADVVTLYNSLNAFVIPSSVGVFQQGNISDTAITLTIGGTVNQDYTISAANNKTLLVLLTFNWSTSGATLTPALTLRVNGAAVSAAQTLNASAAQSGMLFAFIGPHDANAAQTVLAWTIDSGGTSNRFGANANLPTATTTSVGVTFSNATAGTLILQHARIWQEG